MSEKQKYLPVAEPVMSGNELTYISDCVTSGWVSSLGKYIPRFEQEFADFCGTKYGVAVSNGTAAIHLALAVLGIGPGDEVIIPSLTFIATASAVSYCGATPVFADSEPLTWNIDPEDISRRITNRTKAIIPVHLYGHPADMSPILDLAQRHNLYIIEDAAEAHGAYVGDRRVGSLGLINSFSFYGNKVITTGEGGMLTTDDEELSERAMFLRDHAMSPEKRYWHPEIGFNYRMTNLQAALGVAQMEQIESFIERKCWIAETYSELLKDVPGIKLPPNAAWAKPIYWMYSILVEDDFPLSRDELMLHLRQQKIDTRPFFFPIHTMPPFQNQTELPEAMRLSERGINLPSAVSLEEGDIRRVVEAITSCL